MSVTTRGTSSVMHSLVTGCTSIAGSGDANPGNPPAAPTVTVTDNCDGTSTLTATGIAAGATVAWSTGATTPVITVATAGTYTVTQSLGAGCTSIAGSGDANPGS